MIKNRINYGNERKNGTRSEIHIIGHHYPTHSRPLSSLFFRVINQSQNQEFQFNSKMVLNHFNTKCVMLKRFFINFSLFENIFGIQSFCKRRGYNSILVLLAVVKLDHKDDCRISFVSIIDMN